MNDDEYGSPMGLDGHPDSWKDERNVNLLLLAGFVAALVVGCGWPV